MEFIKFKVQSSNKDYGIMKLRYFPFTNKGKPNLVYKPFIVPHRVHTV